MNWPEALVLLAIAVVPFAFLGFVEWMDRRR